MTFLLVRRLVLPFTLIVTGCAANRSAVGGIPGNLSAADTTAIVAAALDAFASPNGPITVVRAKLWCSPQVNPTCPGPPHLLESAAAHSAMQQYATRRNARLSSDRAQVACPWGGSSIAEKGVALSVSVPFVRDNQVRIGVSIGCIEGQRDPNQGFAEGITYQMEFVDQKWRVKAIASHVIT